VTQSGGGTGADLSITKTADQIPVVGLADFTYTIVVVNRGPEDATGVSVNDELPANTDLVAALSGQRICPQNGGTVTCDIGDMSSGAQVAITVTVTPLGFGQYTHTATVTTASQDPNLSNNDDEATVDVQDPGGEAVDLSVQKVASTRHRVVRRDRELHRDPHQHRHGLGHRRDAVRPAAGRGQLRVR